jgi:translation elongation factor EF-Tu-like GTPase
LQNGAKQPTFLFTVENVFYCEPPMDRVILGGSVNEGTVKVGDSLTVQCRSGEVPVVLEDIVMFGRGKVQQASRGQEVGLILRGIRKEQPVPGDRVLANPAYPTVAADRRLLRCFSGSAPPGGGG